jgi:chemotaxis protein methyltransferase CheR
MTAPTNAIADELTLEASVILEAHIGLKPDPSFRPRLARALRDVATARQLAGAQLLAAISAEGPALDDLLERITVQETAFFRHPDHFGAVLDTLLAAISGPVHVWSAAAANGQEPYSLAMSLRERGLAGSVLATDVSRAAVRRISSAVYDAREVRGVSRERLQQHFVPAGAGCYRVREPERDMVIARHHNLLGPIPDDVDRCQIVFCRNVLIYLTAEHATRFLDRLADVMPADSHLVVGSAETIWHINARFEPVQLGSSYVYRRRARRSARVVPQLGAMSRAGAAVAAQVGGAHPQAARPAPPARTQSGRRAAVPSAAEVVPVAVQQPAAGERATAAVVASRRWAYSEPDDPIAHFHLATALDESGHPVAARRAFRSALTALDSRAAGPLGDVLEGYDSAELRRLLVAKCRPRDDLPAGPPAAPSNGTPR